MLATIQLLRHSRVKFRWIWLLFRIVGNPIRSAIQLSKLGFTTAVKFASATEMICADALGNCFPPYEGRCFSESTEEIFLVFKSSCLPFHFRCVGVCKFIQHKSHSWRGSVFAGVSSKVSSRNLAARPLVSLSELGPRFRSRFGTCASCNLRMSLLSLQRLYNCCFVGEQGGAEDRSSLVSDLEQFGGCRRSTTHTLESHNSPSSRTDWIVMVSAWGLRGAPSNFARVGYGLMS